MATYLAIHVGTDRLAAGVVDEAGHVLVRDRVATPQRDVWPALHRLVRRVMAARPDDAEPLVICGVGCEGPIDVVAGTVSPFHLPVWQRFELRERIGDLTGLPAVLGPTAQGLVVAERWRGAATTVTDVMVLLMSEAVEAGIISNDRLLQGRTGNAGQLGHVVVEPDGLPCVCGGAGCLTSYVSAASIEEETNRPLRRAPASVIERAGVMIGRAVASSVAVFDLRLVVLTGSVPATFGQALLDAARRELDLRSRLAHVRGGPDAEHRVRLELTALGREAPIVGAAALARSHWLAAEASGRQAASVR